MNENNDDHVAQLMMFCQGKLGKEELNMMHLCAANDVEEALKAARIENASLHELLTGTVMVYWMTGIMKGHTVGFTEAKER